MPETLTRLPENWLAAVIFDWVELANSLTLSETGIKIYSNLMAWAIGKQISASLADIVILFEWVSSDQKLRFQNSYLSYSQDVEIAVRVYVTRHNTAKRNAYIACEVIEKLIKLILNYENTYIYGTVLMKPQEIHNVSNDGVPEGTVYVSCSFGIKRKAEY